jgi:hypothetical protein
METCTSVKVQCPLGGSKLLEMSNVGTLSQASCISYSAILALLYRVVFLLMFTTNGKAPASAFLQKLCAAIAELAYVV